MKFEITNEYLINFREGVYEEVVIDKVPDEIALRHGGSFETKRTGVFINFDTLHDLMHFVSQHDDGVIITNSGADKLTHCLTIKQPSTYR